MPHAQSRPTCTRKHIRTFLAEVQRECREDDGLKQAEEALQRELAQAKEHVYSIQIALLQAAQENLVEKYVAAFKELPNKDDSPEEQPLPPSVLPQSVASTAGPELDPKALQATLNEEYDKQKAIYLARLAARQAKAKKYLGESAS